MGVSCFSCNFLQFVGGWQHVLMSVFHSVIILAKRVFMYSISRIVAELIYCLCFSKCFKNVCNPFLPHCWQNNTFGASCYDKYLFAITLLCPVHKCKASEGHLLGSLPSKCLVAHWPWVSILKMYEEKLEKGDTVRVFLYFFLNVKVNERVLFSAWGFKDNFLILCAHCVNSI